MSNNSKVNTFLRRLLMFMASKGFLNILSDKFYLKLVYRANLGQKLDLENPKSFNEKLQWLKLNNRNPEYTKLVDKYEAKIIIADKIGDEYIIPTLGVWDRFDDIDFESLPSQFVLKCTHDSGGVVICKDKSNFDFTTAKEKINRSLRRNFYYYGREWPYKNVKPRIIAEKYIEDTNGGLVDYKFFCFNGIADSVMICLDRHLNDTKFYFFDKNWALKRINKRGLEAPEGFTLPKPLCMDKMFEMAEELSKDIPFVRVDLFEADNRIFFGELTFFPDSGLDSNITIDVDKYWGSLIEIKK